MQTAPPLDTISPRNIDPVPENMHAGVRASGQLMRSEFFHLSNAIVRGLILSCLLWAIVGCNQNQAGAPAGAAPYNSFGAAAPSSSYAVDMQARANEQIRLANEQQRMIESMKAEQARTNEQLLALQKQQEQSQQSKVDEKKAQETMLANQAREALGRYDELGRRAKSLDARNQDLYAEFSQVQQRIQLLEDQNHLLQQRLKDTSAQLAEALKSGEEAKNQYDSLLTSTRQRSGASITANNSYSGGLTAVTVDGLNVRQDGDLVRIEIPSDRLFQSDGATLRPEASDTMNKVSDVILRTYPRQVIGVEAHTDRDPNGAGGWRSAHQLTAAQSMAVFEALSAKHQSLRNQLFILGHANNYPLASNGTVAGQAKNRRVEIVIYPESAGNR